MQLDPTDAKVALAQAQAELGQAERKVHGYFANEQALAGQVAARAADIARADAQIVERPVRPRPRPHRARPPPAAGPDRRGLRRRADPGAEPLDHAPRRPSAQARAATIQAEANRRRGRSGQQRRQHRPDQRRAGLRATPRSPPPGPRSPPPSSTLTAPCSARRSTAWSPRRTSQIGQRVQVGATLMTVVPIDQAYVDANFKEVQLRKVRDGPAGRADRRPLRRRREVPRPCGRASPAAPARPSP